MKLHGLRNRVVAAFLLSALAIAALFIFFNLMFIYSVEDSAFTNLLDEEMSHQRHYWQQYGQLTEPLREYVTLYTTPAQFPPDVQRTFLEAPDQREFFGDNGRHYHLRVFQPAPNRPPAFLLAEVGDYLLVRPIRSRMLAFYGASALLVLVLSGLIGYLLACRATAPLTRLVKLLEGIEPGKHTPSFAGNVPDNEIGVLAQALEQAWRRVAEFVEREQHFTRDASHELRTPVTVIRSAAELMARQTLPAPARQQLHQIHGACLQMEQTIDALLSLARESASGAAEPVALLPVLERTIVQSAHLLDEGKVCLDVRVPHDAVVRLPAPVLGIVLGNIVSNAFHFTEAGRIYVSYCGNMLLVRDSGPGIDDRLLDRLYEPLVKGGASRGYGLGLSIVKRLCDRHGALLRIDTRCGTGTSVELHFPLPEGNR